ncbi:hypothetical protein RJT34_14039 [Clitoria ternatea]|uniref:Uncharacterized protein n=1 Tax=Clitoria ternatea TaxID=43366 RepID=A0AAN9PMD4_CLITE
MKPLPYHYMSQMVPLRRLDSKVDAALGFCRQVMQMLESLDRKVETNVGMSNTMFQLMQEKEARDSKLVEMVESLREMVTFIKSVLRFKLGVAPTDVLSENGEERGN